MLLATVILISSSVNLIPSLPFEIIEKLESSSITYRYGLFHESVSHDLLNGLEPTKSYIVDH